MIAHYSIGKGVIDRLWMKAKDSRNIYRSMDGSSYSTFQKNMLYSDAVYEFPFGALRIDGIYTDTVRVHGIFWSKDVFRNIDRMKDALLRLGRTFGIREVYCEFPRGTRSIRRLLESGGFVFYGNGDKQIGEYEYVPTDIYMLHLM